MAELLIAIVGSTNLERRDYDPPLRNREQAKLAAVELGRELAKAKHRILVYSSDPGYIEADVVRGYVESGMADAESILLRYPAIAGPVPHFREQDKDYYGPCFKDDPDDSPNWQVCFFSALQKADAVLLLGGASSSLITFLIAEMTGIALIPIATFGGSAQTVWGLASRRFDEKVRRITGAPLWRPDSAAQLVDALASEHTGRDRKESKARDHAGAATDSCYTAQSKTISQASRPFGNSTAARGGSDPAGHILANHDAHLLWNILLADSPTSRSNGRHRSQSP